MVLLFSVFSSLRLISSRSRKGTVSQQGGSQPTLMFSTYIYDQGFSHSCFIFCLEEHRSCYVRRGACSAWKIDHDWKFGSVIIGEPTSKVQSIWMSIHTDTLVHSVFPTSSFRSPLSLRRVWF